MKARKAIEQVALQYGISASEVRQDIQKALDAGWNNPDALVQEYWRKIPTKYEKPTPEEVITYLSKQSK